MENITKASRDDKMHTRMQGVRFGLSVILLSLLSFILPQQTYAAMSDYCVVPPFVTHGLKPNLLLMLDNSASQYDLEYIAGSTSAPPTYSCGSTTVSGSYCYDSTYSDTTDYEGYFNRADPSTGTPVYYSYSGGKFVSGAALPGGCTYSTGYLCINMVGAGATRAISQFVASGRFLNWLSASKFDVQKKVLTGGKFDVTNQVLVGESRGCVGKRFVKELPGLAGLTFAVRGPNSLEADYSATTQGGQTRIEVYEADYNETSCQCAVYNWEQGNYGQASTNTDSCLGDTASGRESATFNHSLQTCWLIKDNYDKGRLLWQGVNIQDITTACTNVYTKDLILPATILDDSNGNYICTSVATHGNALLAPYNDMGNDSAGYVGECWQGSANKFTGKDDCVKQEILHYCAGVKYAEVIDPTKGTFDTNLTGNIPAVVMDAGVGAVANSIGPSGSADKFFYAKVSTTAPTGLVQRFQNLVRFGAMTFNDIGSTAECGKANSMISCTAAPNKDGGKVIAYIGAGKCSVSTGTSCLNDSDCPGGEQCIPFVGDHSSGLVNAIDSVRASSWTPFSEAFYEAIGYYAQRSDLRLNADDYLVDASHNPTQYDCQRNNLLLITDGQSTADLNASVVSQVSSTHFPDTEGSPPPYTTSQYDSAINATCPVKYAGSRNVDDLAWLAQTKKITNFSADPVYEKDKIYTYVVYSGTDSLVADQCNPAVLMRDTAIRGGGNYYKVDNASQLQQKLLLAFEDIIKRASSGTAASVLASGEGSGANLIQALFYPSRKFYNVSTGVYDEIMWAGRLLNLWYYVDPFFTYSNIREDKAPGDRKLILSTDRIVKTYFDQTTESTKARLYTDVNGDGGKTQTLSGDVPIEEVANLWEAGQLLWQRPPGQRTIYYTTDGSTRATLPNAFPATIDATLRTYLQASGNDEAQAIVRFIRGEDTLPGGNFATNPLAGFSPIYRNRTVTLDLNKNNVLDAGESNVWKLGDVVNSTPRVSSWIQMNNYDTRYTDTSYKAFVNSSNYTDRGMVFTGANDGMLHAFKLGKLELPGKSATCTDKACLSGTELGKEMWALIPKNALPYLKYTADTAYCHIYSMDLTPTVFDASINGASGDDRNSDGSSWRTILIGGMRTGGACRNSTGACNSTTDGQPDCVKTPIDGVGYSSYFALDVTDQNSPPVLLWEFSSSDLGFATTGPAIVRVNGGPSQTTPDKKNGNWYAVLASGPTGPISPTNQQFLGRSDQNLKLFVLNLKTGALVRSIDTGISNAFAGSISYSTFDADDNYQDDTLYIGYVQKDVNTWTKGGVLRLLTKESEPGQWTVSSVIDNTGPVVSSVMRLQDDENHILWLYFGTGRYYFKQAALVDDADGPRTLYGIKEPCFTTANKMDGLCTAAPVSGLTDVTSVGNAPTSEDANEPAFKGWSIGLDGTGSYTYCDTYSSDGTTCSQSSTRNYRAERVITNPVATSFGLVLFTTYKPYNDICSLGGKSFIWGVGHNTGGAPGTLGKGIALLQVSTGSIEQKDLSVAFKQNAQTNQDSRGDRRTGAMEGVTPQDQGLSYISPPPPSKRKVIHTIER